MKILYTLLLIFISSVVFSQNRREIETIVKSNNTKELNLLKIKEENKFYQEKNEAIQFANKNGIPLNYSENGSYFSIRKIVEGKPVYYKTFNVNAARSTRASFLHNGGGMGLNIEGQGMTAFVWDGGHALINHQEFMVGGSSKLTPADTNSETDPEGLNHATHVMGTILAQGVNASAKGMAPQANGYVLDWNNDVAEVISGTGIGMLLSNHSYGPNLANLSDWSIGAYNSESRVWDDIMFNAPYYLMVCAAGNDGNDYFSNGDALDGNPNYDKLYGQTTSKNSMVVANANDAIVSSIGNIVGSGNINSSSSQGPTDDYRIKPDITGNGTNVMSSIHTSISSYDSYTGTSMASPNVCGSLLLLQQLYNQENSSFMYASTIKGLALHTADDRGSVGPDAVYGWGYMNTKKAAEVILDNNFLILERTLNNGDSFSFEVTASGTEALKASISWTDEKGVANNGNSNDHTPALVNDIDIRITKNGTTYLPWKLTNVSTNTKGDNIVDPYERVDVDNAISGDIYTVTISHKGGLSNGLQNYSIIVTGISSSTANINQNIYSDFKLFPNPSTGMVNIALNNSITSNLTIYNTLGKVVYSKLLNDNSIQQVNLASLNPGVYYISIKNQKSKSIKKLIIK